MYKFNTMIPDGYYKIIGFSRNLPTKNLKPYKRVKIAANGQAHIMNIYRNFNLLQAGRVYYMRFDAKMNIRHISTLTEFDKRKILREIQERTEAQKNA